jgi:hypothetical protein
VRGPAFDRENFGDSLWVEGIGSQTINRFRGQGDHFTGTEQGRGAFDGGVK